MEAVRAVAGTLRRADRGGRLTPDPDLLFREAERARACGDWDRAGETCSKILRLDPNHLGATRLLGAVAATTRRHGLAVQALQRALQVDPNDFDSLIWLGIVQHDLGEFAIAEGHFERARALRPDALAPLIGLLRGRRVTEADRALIVEARERLLREEGTADEQRQLAYAIGKALDELGEYEQAMGCFDVANRLAYRLQKPNGFDRKRYSDRLDQVMSVFTKESLNKLEFGSRSLKPIFIVGMIRSGTTLVEQILSRHSRVKAGGELSFWIQNAPNALQANTLNPRFAAFLGEKYLDLLNRIGPGADRVTDKMPINFMLLGVMHAIFPRATIVHCRRDPLDTCLSIYMTPFGQPPDFGYDRDEIAFGYREYLRVMTHWRSVFPPGRMFELDYETLVSRPESAIRELVAHCGLEWEEECLSPEANRRVVETPSRWQVRQPLYTTSVGKARNYRAWLGPIAELTRDR